MCPNRHPLLWSISKLHRHATTLVIYFEETRKTDGFENFISSFDAAAFLTASLDKVSIHYRCIACIDSIV
jgi:hypothetical protein